MPDHSICWGCGQDVDHAIGHVCPFLDDWDDDGGSSVPSRVPDPPNNPGPARAEMELCYAQ